MTEVAIRRDVVDHQSAAIQRLTDWAASADAAYQVAVRLVDSSFVPKQFQGKPIEAAAAILAGLEVGLQPMAALRSFDIISGQAAPRAVTLRAIVLSYGHEVELVESTATKCRMRGRRKGSADWQPVHWTIERAQALGLTSKDNWKKQPGAMLVARATSEVCRLIAADAILGIGYSSEEVLDGVTGDVTSVAPAASTGTGRKMSYTPPAVEQTTTEHPDAPVDHAALADTRTQIVEPNPADDDTAAQARQQAAAEEEERIGITRPQLSKLSILAKELGLDSRDARDVYLDAIEVLALRRVGSAQELTKREASWIIEAWQQKVASAPKPDAPAQVEDTSTREQRLEVYHLIVDQAVAAGHTEADAKAALEQHYALPVADLTLDQLTGYSQRHPFAPKAE